MNKNKKESQEKIQELIAETEGGIRTPRGFSYRVLFIVPLIWSIFQIWYASPLPFAIGLGVFNDTEARSIHLAFALFLAFLAYPASKKSPRDTIPMLDWALALVGAFCAAYIFIFYEQLAERSGAPIFADMAAGIVGLVILLEATRRALGLPLTIVALVFLTYTYFGPYMPDVIAHKGQSLSKIVSHQWVTTEGVFGIALGVSTSFVFLFVLFGAMLEKAKERLTIKQLEKMGWGGSLLNGGICRDLLYRCHPTCHFTGFNILYCAILYRTSGST